MSGSFPFPIQCSQNTPSGADSDRDRTKAKPFRCGDCEQDFSAICLLHTHLRGGSYHYDQDTMTAFPLGGTTCSSVFKRLKMEKTAVAPDSTRKIFKIKKIRQKGKKKKLSLADSDEEWNASKENEGYHIGDYEKAFNVTPSIETVNDEADAEIDDSEQAREEMNAPPSVAEVGGTSPNKKRQLVINLYGMDRNEDGSLRLVVGEKDSGVFKTPAGDAILKALKTKGKMFKGHMKVIYNYPDNVEPPEESEEVTEDAEMTELAVHTPSKMKTRSSGNGESAAKKLKLDDPSGNQSDTITIEPISPVGKGENSIIKVPAKEPGDAPVFKVSEERMTTMEATEVLNEVLSGHHLELIVRKQILRPRGGEIYILDLDALPKDRRVDTFKWNNCGSKKYPKKKEIIMKTVYKVRLPNGYFSDVFVKHFYQLLDSSRYCMIHYIGDPPVL